jgi:hypothetical protein
MAQILAICILGIHDPCWNPSLIDKEVLIAKCVNHLMSLESNVMLIKALKLSYRIITFQPNQFVIDFYFNVGSS